MALVTIGLPFAGAPMTGNAGWDQGFLYAIPPLPESAWAYPMRVDMYLEQSYYLNRASCEAYLMRTPGTTNNGWPATLFGQFNFDDTFGYINLVQGNYGPMPAPTYLGLLNSGGSFTRDHVRISGVTLTYTSPEGPSDNGTIEFQKLVKGADLNDLVNVAFMLTARNELEEATIGAQVSPLGALDPVRVSIRAGLTTLSESLDALPRVVGGRRTKWKDAIFDPPSLTVHSGETHFVTVTNTVTFPGGLWGLRQRQSLAGNAGGWPLRQRQNGGATGSWPLRQRQTGT